MLISDFCEYSDAYIVVKGTITFECTNNMKIRNKKLIFKNNAPFKKFISKINNPFTDDTENLDIVTPMQNTVTIILSQQEVCEIITKIK